MLRVGRGSFRTVLQSARPSSVWDWWFFCYLYIHYAQIDLTFLPLRPMLNTEVAAGSLPIHPTARFASRTGDGCEWKNRKFVHADAFSLGYFLPRYKRRHWYITLNEACRADGVPKHINGFLASNKRWRSKVAAAKRRDSSAHGGSVLDLEMYIVRHRKWLLQRAACCDIYVS